MYYELTDRFIVRADLDRTWRFFSMAENLPRITPPWLNFTVQTPAPITIGPESVLDYTIRWAGVPIRWRTLITDWRPPMGFEDLQIKGPYTMWLHQHRFEPSDEGVICSDRVIYKLPGGPIGRLANTLTVRRQLTDIFRYRRQVITEDLGWVRAVQEDVQVKRI